MRLFSTLSIFWLVGLSALHSQSLQAFTPRGNQVSMGRAIYYVSYDIEYGYTFDLAESDSRIFPAIAETELPKFDQFFSNENMARVAGKRIFCNCKIVTYRDGSTRVVAADLYAR